MAYGDVGGVVTELIITCKTKSSGAVAIAAGDVVKLTGAYVVDNATADEDVVFGQAMAAADTNSTPLSVKVRGVCVFTYSGTAPTVNGTAGIVASATDGKVKAPASGNGRGINLKTNAADTTVHVLL
jgi:hypothetical protein